MKNWLKLALIAFLLLPSVSFASGHGESEGGHGESGGHGGESKKKEDEGNFSKADLDEMKQSQLLYYLANPNYQSSEYATYYFIQKGKEGVTPLINHLKKNEDNDKVVSAVIYTFGRMGKNAARAVPVITKQLNSDNFEIRKTAIAALGKIGKASDPAVPEIAKYLTNDNEWTRTTALRSLKEIGTKQSLAIANQYEKKIKLDEERKNKELMGTNNSGNGVNNGSTSAVSSQSEPTK